MPPRDWAFRVQDILDAIAKIRRFTSDVDFEVFENDEELLDAVVHNLTVIGEAANHIPSDITGRHPDIPWRQMVDLRNFSVHAYWGRGIHRGRRVGRDLLDTAQIHGFSVVFSHHAGGTRGDAGVYRGCADWEFVDPKTLPLINTDKALIHTDEKKRDLPRICAEERG